MRPLEPISWKKEFVDVIVGPPDCRVLITPKGSRSYVYTGITRGVTCLVSSASQSCFAFWSAWMAPRIQSVSLSAQDGVAYSNPPASSITTITDRGMLPGYRRYGCIRLVGLPSYCFCPLREDARLILADALASVPAIIPENGTGAVFGVTVRRVFPPCVR